MSLYNINSGYGQLQAIAIANKISTFGRFLIVIPNTDPNYERVVNLFKVDGGDGKVRLFNTLNEAYNEAISNSNDVILMSSYSSHTITPILWTKNRIHVIGLDGGDRLIQQGAKIQNSITSTEAYVIKDIGVRNSFINLKTIQISTEATALSVFQGGGEGTLFKNTSYVFGVDDNLGDVNASEFIAGTDSCTFLDCTFGSDTLLTTVARTVFKIDQVVPSQEFKSNILRRCNFLISSSDADAKLISGVATSDIKFTNHFDSPTLMATIVGSASAIALNSAVSTPDGLVEGGIYLSYPRAFNITNLGVNGGNNDNLQVVAPLCSNTDIVGTAPIAT